MKHQWAFNPSQYAEDVNCHPQNYCYECGNTYAPHLSGPPYSMDVPDDSVCLGHTESVMDDPDFGFGYGDYYRED